MIKLEKYIDKVCKQLYKERHENTRTKACIQYEGIIFNHNYGLDL